MARIRTIKPQLPEDETLGRCSRDARLLFVLGITRADDYGRLRASGAYLRGALFPYDVGLSPDEVEQWVQELAATGRWALYSVRGERYAGYRGWIKHQRIDNRGRPACPEPPPEAGLVLAASNLRGGDQPVENPADNGIPRSAAKRRDSPLEGEEEREVGEEEEQELEKEGSARVATIQPGLAEPPGGSSPLPNAEGFATLWARWPAAKQTREADARAAWLRAMGDATAEEVLASAGRWLAYWAAEDTPVAYVPRPSRWLDGGDWRTAPPAARTNGDARRAAARAELQAFLEGG